MFTNTARRLNDDVDFLPSGATTGGLNWDWRFAKSTYSLSGYWAASSVRGSAEAIDGLQSSAVHYYQRPDADHIEYDPTRTTLNGQAGMVAFSKIGGKRVRFNVNTNFKTPGFDINDVGYVRRADAIQQSAWMQIRWDEPSKWYRTLRINFNQWAGWTFGGDKRFTGGNFNAHIVLPSNWAAGFGLNAEGNGLDDRATRGGPGITSVKGGNVWYYVQSDERKALNGMWQGYYYRDETGSTDVGADPALTWRPTSFLSLSGGVLVPHERRDPVGGEPRRGRFHALRVRTDSPDDRRPDDAGELHDHADVERADLRAAIRLVGRVLQFQTTRTAACRTVQRAVRSDDVRRQSRLHLQVAADDERAAVGVQAGVGALRGLAAGPGGLERRGAVPLPGELL